MISLIAVGLIGYIVASLTVGISYFALFGERIGLRYKRTAFLILLVLFAVLDLYWIPAVAPLDMSITIGNQDVARVLEAEAPIRVNDILEFA